MGGGKKLLHLLMALLMLSFYVLPIMEMFLNSNAEVVSSLSNLQFATNAQLQSDFDLNGKTEAHILFGNRPYGENYYKSSWDYSDILTVTSGNVDWKIAGKDGSGYVVLYNSDVLVGANWANNGGDVPSSGHYDSRFDLTGNNSYKDSKIKDTLDSMSCNTNYFKSSEQLLMADTTLTTLMKTTSSVTQKLYLAGAKGARGDYTDIYVGSSDNLIIPVTKWGAIHWLRSPNYSSTTFNDALATDTSSAYVRNRYVDGTNVAISCAFKLDLDSVRFASSATSTNSTAQSTTSGTFSTISGTPAMRLRTNGLSNAPTVNGSTVTFNATSSQRLMVQVNDGTNNYQTYFNGNGSKQTVNLNKIGKNAKVIWSTTSSAGDTGSLQPWQRSRGCCPRSRSQSWSAFRLRR